MNIAHSLLSPVELKRESFHFFKDSAWTQKEWVKSGLTAASDILGWFVTAEQIGHGVWVVHYGHTFVLLFGLSVAFVMHFTASEEEQCEMNKVCLIFTSKPDHVTSCEVAQNIFGLQDFLLKLTLIFQEIHKITFIILKRFTRLLWHSSRCPIKVHIIFIWHK